MENQRQINAVTVLTIVAIVTAVKTASANDELLLSTLQVLKMDSQKIAYAFDIEVIKTLQEEANTNVALDSKSVLESIEYLHNLFSK